jgi:hypothetical protein
MFKSFMSAGIVLITTTAIGAFGQNTIVVTPANLAGWTTQRQSCGALPITSSHTFVNGPATPPAGTGSLRFQIGTNGDSFEAVRQSSFDGVRLADLKNLNYYTYVMQFGSGGQAVYLTLTLDTDGDGVADDALFFEPVYQNGTYSTHPATVVPNQCGSNPSCVVLGQWQPWNALIGGWWSNNEAGGPPLWTLASYNAAHGGNVKIVQATSGGGVRLATGCGGDAWANFDGNTDKLTIGAQGRGQITYDFELNSMPGSKDACKDGGWKTFNPPPPIGPFKNQGDCVSFVNTGK